MLANANQTSFAGTKRSYYSDEVNNSSAETNQNNEQFDDTLVDQSDVMSLITEQSLFRSEGTTAMTTSQCPLITQLLTPPRFRYSGDNLHKLPIDLMNAVSSSRSDETKMIIDSNYTEDVVFYTKGLRSTSTVGRDNYYLMFNQMRNLISNLSMIVKGVKVIEDDEGWYFQ